LRLIESLLSSQKLIVIMSALEPSAYSANGSVPGHVSENANDENLKERWACVLSRFKKVYSGATIVGVSEDALSKLEGDSGSVISPEKRSRVLALAGQVYEECAPLPCLQQLSNDIISRLPFEDRPWNEIRREIFDRAELYYRQIWDNCSDGERLTLIHLAQDRLLSPNDPDIGLLLRKRLLIFAPDL